MAPALAAACVAVIALAVTLVLGGGSSQHRSPAGGRAIDSLAGVLGRSWALTEVRAPNGTTTAIPASLSAEITFLPKRGQLELQDGVSAWRMTYVVGSDGRLRLHVVEPNPVEYCGHDRAQLAAIAGVEPLTYNTTGVSVRLSAGRLRIIANGYTLTLANPVPVARSASPGRSVPSAPANVRTTSASAQVGPHC